MGDYREFVSKKLSATQPVGFDASLDQYDLFPHQVDLTRWALRRGRAAIFADTGLGKSRMQIAWADRVVAHTGGRVLILAPLAVAEQTREEAASIGVKIRHVREADQVCDGISITNYDRLHKFDPRQFSGVVLDESSIIKHHTAKTLQQLLDAFRHTPYRLCATATPAPNDWTELGTHAEFLGIRSRQEMLSEFFVHDGGETQTWRLKGHARQAFWRWVASWGALVRSPADLGHDASMYRLPPLEVEQVTVELPYQPTEGLFHNEAQTLMDRRRARRDSIEQRVLAVASLVEQDMRESWVIWCDLNAEGDALRSHIADAVEIRGSDETDEKEQRLNDFAHGKIRVLVTKPSIAGFGLNWQHCARVAFVGVTDSFEAYYQAVRRCWRFGQTRPVKVYVFAAETEGAVVANLNRKELDALRMSESLSAETLDAVRGSVVGAFRESNEYRPDKAIYLPEFMSA